MKHIITTLFLACLLSCQGQTNTLKFETSTVSPKANIQDVSWITGHWKGEAFGGITEEIWSPPLGGSMMFSFKLVDQGKVVFYELGGIREIDGTLLFQLKHFNEDFKGWEEKNETIDAKLIKMEANRVYFDQFAFEKVGENELNIYVVIEEKGKTEEVKFNYKRYKK
jgi:hypothetical protein